MLSRQLVTMSVGKNGNMLQFKSNTALDAMVWPFIKNKLQDKNKYSTEFNIYLRQNGFQIGKGIKTLLPEHEDVRSGSYQWMAWADSKYLKSPQEGAFSYLAIDPVDRNDHAKGYRLIIPRGEIKPRIISNRSNPLFWSRLIATTNHSHGTKEDQKSIWYINTVS